MQPSERAPMSALVSMFLVSGSILVLQVSLSRVLSVIASYHAAFLVASLAMLGLTASAIDGYVKKQRDPASFNEDDAASAGARAALILAGSLLVLLQTGRFESLATAGTVIGVIGVLATFHQAGYVVAFLLDRHAADVARVYFIDLVGAAAGCGLAVALLGFVPAPTVMLVCGAAVALAALAIAKDRRLPGAAVAVAFLAVLLGGVTPLYRVHRAKDQPQDRVLWERWNRLARVTVTETMPGLDRALTLMRAQRPVTSEEAAHLDGLWRLGWGASDRYTGDVPPMMWIQLDADAGTQIIEGGTGANLEFLEWDVTTAAHQLRRDQIDNAFVIGGGGGRDVLTALHFGAKHVDVVEINPAVVEVVRFGFPDFVRAPAYDDPRVTLTIGEGRSALARATGKYDMVQMSLVDTWAASMAGAMVLSENTLYTREAFDAYVAHLSDHGVLTVSRWYDPVAWGETARVVRLASQALRDNGIEAPEEHLAVLYTRGFLGAGVATIVASRAPLTDADRAVLERLTDVQGFGVLWPSTKNTVDHGWDIAGVIAGTPAVLADPTFDLSVPTDERPFFFNVRWPFASWVDAIRLGDKSLGSPSTAVFGGALLLLGTVGGGLVARPLRDRKSGGWISGGAALYFGGIGAGFMAIEMSLVQRYIVFLGHPTYALSVVLFALLLGSGLGSALSGGSTNPRRHAPYAAGLVVLATMITAFVIPNLLAQALQLSLAARVAVAVACIGPQAICMGTLWPLGVRLLHDRGLGASTPFMWATNGLCGVLASVLAVFAATLWGYTTVLCIGALAYIVVSVASQLAWAPVATQPATSSRR